MTKEDDAKCTCGAQYGRPWHSKVCRVYATAAKCDCGLILGHQGVHAVPDNLPSNLVAELHACNAIKGTVQANGLMTRAADEIERLTRERDDSFDKAVSRGTEAARLRAALEQVGGLGYTSTMDYHSLRAKYIHARTIAADALKHPEPGCRYPMSYGQRCKVYPHCPCGATPVNPP